jgi:lysine 2,3-aminomutase
MRRLAPLPLAASAPRVARAEVTAAEWLDWRWQLRNMVTTADELAGLVELTAAERDGLRRSHALFRFGATPYYVDLMDRRHPWCPIRMQTIPSADELAIRDEELVDPLGEDSRSPTPAIVHKYPDRVLLLAVDRCAIYCRHCNRRRLVGGDRPTTRDELEQAYDYIARTPAVRDVLISGGDPLLLATDRLRAILARLRAIPHVEIIRIGSRVPVVLPMRIDDELVAALREHHPLYVNTHFNHAKEITPLARAACERMVDAGIPVGNQTVLLRRVNSSIRCLQELMRALVRMRVRPYYLFQGDTVIGTDHLRTPVETAIELMDGMRGWMSGMAIPHLVLDAPGGGGKIPLGPQYLQSLDAREVTLRNYRGDKVCYPQPRERDCSVPYDAVWFGDRETSR